MEGREEESGREAERIDECRHSGRGDERWRALFFSLSQCREVTSSSTIWRECHATLALPLPQTQMKFYFLCHTVERKQFFLSLINVRDAGKAVHKQAVKKELLSLYTFLLWSATCINQTADRSRGEAQCPGFPPSGCHLGCSLIGELTPFLRGPAGSHTNISCSSSSSFFFLKRLV